MVNFLAGFLDLIGRHFKGLFPATGRTNNRCLREEVVGVGMVAMGVGIDEKTYRVVGDLPDPVFKIFDGYIKLVRESTTKAFSPRRSIRHCCCKKQKVVNKRKLPHQFFSFPPAGPYLAYPWSSLLN